jgi:hypothetical protein
VTDDDILDGIPAKVLKRDLMRAYQRKGGAEWLVTLPDGLFLKYLMALIPQTMDQKHDGVVRMIMSLPRTPLDDGPPGEEPRKDVVFVEHDDPRWLNYRPKDSKQK